METNTTTTNTSTMYRRNTTSEMPVFNRHDFLARIHMWHGRLILPSHRHIHVACMSHTRTYNTRIAYIIAIHFYHTAETKVTKSLWRNDQLLPYLSISKFKNQDCYLFQLCILYILWHSEKVVQLCVSWGTRPRSHTKERHVYCNCVTVVQISISMFLQRASTATITHTHEFRPLLLRPQCICKKQKCCKPCNIINKSGFVFKFPYSL